MDEATVEIAEIRAALTQVLDAIEGQLGSTVRLSEDYYWDLPVRAAFEMGDPQPELTAGQLVDDLRELREGLRNPDGVEVATWHALAHVIALLRFLERLVLA